MTSDGEATKMKVIDLEKLHNFVIDNFYIWNHLSKEIYVRIFSHFKFEILKWPRMEKRPKQKL